MMSDSETRDAAFNPNVQSPLPGVTAKDGLLYRAGALVDLPEADTLAFKCGLHCAEQLVRILENPPGKPGGEEQEHR